MLLFFLPKVQNSFNLISSSIKNLFTPVDTSWKTLKFTMKIQTNKNPNEKIQNETDNTKKL